MALNPFMKIDGKRQAPEETLGAKVLVIPKEKSQRSLKTCNQAAISLVLEQETEGDVLIIIPIKVNIVSWNVRGFNDPGKRLLINIMLHK